MKTRFAIAFLTVLAGAPLPATPAAAQQDDQEWLDRCRRQTSNRSDRERFCEVRSETFRANGGPIKVSPGQNGGVSVESWSGSEIEVRARIQSQAREVSRATSIAKDIRVAHNGNSIVASGPDLDHDNNESWSVMYVIRVPRNSDLQLNTVNGPISIRNVRGIIEANTTNGPLSLSDVAGDVHARTTNGPLSVSLGGDRWAGTGLDAQTSNGPVTLSMPEDYNADLETGTTNGPFSTEIPLNVRMLGQRTTHITTKIGNGGQPVKVVTTNGPINIRKR
jgi:hypothetical protein